MSETDDHFSTVNEKAYIVEPVRKGKQRPRLCGRLAREGTGGLLAFESSSNRIVTRNVAEHDAAGLDGSALRGQIFQTRARALG